MRPTIVTSFSTGVLLLACSSSDPTASTAQAVKKIVGQYQFTVLDASGIANATTAAINDDSLIVGYAPEDLATFYSPTKPLLYSRGVWSVVNTGSEALSAVFYGVSNNGQVSGATFSSPDYTNWRAAIYDVHHGSWTTLPTPGIQGKDVHFADDINDSGVVVGGSTTVAYENTDGWIWNGSEYTIFDVPGSYGGACPYWEGNGRGTVPQSINDRGDVSGYYSDSNCFWQGFLKVGSKFTQVAPPGAGMSLANCITNEGVIGGTWCTFDDGCVSNHGFVLKGGVYTVFDFPSSWGNNAATYLAGINDRGTIVGSFVDSEGQAHSFVGAPQH